MNTYSVKSFSIPKLFYFAQRVWGRGWGDSDIKMFGKNGSETNRRKCCRFTQDIEAKKETGKCPL